MSNKLKNILLTTVILILYAGLTIGMGFIWNMFWKVDRTTSIIYWVSKGIVIASIVFFAIIMLFSKKDKGVGAFQLFFSIMLTLLPILLRALCMIPTAGKYLAIILAFIVIVLYFMLMVLLQGYGKGEGNKKI